MFSGQKRVSNVPDNLPVIRDELRYILDPKDVYGRDFPGETSRVLKECEIWEYRTRRLVLEKWDEMFG